MPSTTPRRTRRARLAGAAALTAVASLAVASPALAQQKADTTQAEQQCRQLGGSWRPGVYGGVEGYGCRIDLFYGCGVDIHYGPDGRVLGGDAWCLGYNTDWVTRR